MQAAILVRQHSQRRVVAHRAGGFLCIFDHRLEQQFQFFQRIAGRDLTPAQLVAGEFGFGGLLRADDVVDRGHVFRPVAKRLRRRQLLLQVGVVIEFPFGKIDRNHLARTQPALFDDLCFPDRHHAGFGAHDQQPVHCNGVTHRAQTVAVDAAQHPTSRRSR